jgi:hypothetical protein
MDAALRAGFAGFAVAATGDQTVTFDHPTATSLTLDRSALPTEMGPK